jgi:hypothetical protein
MGPSELPLDLLQTIESAIAGVFREHRDLIDYDVMSALEAAATLFSAEKDDRPPRMAKLSENATHTFQAITLFCYWRLGKAGLQTDTGEEVAMDPMNSYDEVNAGLKKIRKSAEKWNKRGGRQGYLNFVSQFV